MRNNEIRLLLLFTVVIMTSGPLLATFYLLDNSLQTTLNLGFNNSILQVLDKGSASLKTLKQLDPQNEKEYRDQFKEIEDLKHIYSNPQLVKANVLGSLKVYFGSGIAAAVLLSLFVTFFLSRKIANSYQLVFDDLISHKEKISYLEEISSWQELAKMLAHEIKNPLTPIEVLISSLLKTYNSKSTEEFRNKLTETQTMVNEELNQLKSIVNKFSEFAKVPSVQLTEENLGEIVDRTLVIMRSMFENLNITIETKKIINETRVMLDQAMFRQVMVNLIRNGIEANPNSEVFFTINMIDDKENIRIEISNSGTTIPTHMASRIFDPYVSSKEGKTNMGLGLTIVRKIIVEHGGDIEYIEVDGKPTFAIYLKKVV